MNPTPVRSKSELLSRMYHNPERKPALTMIAELLFLTVLQRRMPYHYFSRYLFRKDRTNLNDYVPNQNLHRLKPVFNDSAVAEVVENKLYFDFFYRNLNVPVPKILMFNHHQIFVIQNKSFKIEDAGQFRKVLEEIMPHDGTEESIFIKQTYGTYGGSKIYKISGAELAANPSKVEELYPIVTSAGFIFQKTLTQHPILNKLNPSCINTIRFDTFIDKEGNVEIISAYIRMSINNLHVDNIGSGGCYVGIELESGQLKKEGYLTFEEFAGEILFEHPVTHTPFEGFEIPMFSEAKKLIIDVAGYVPGLRIVGWDMAICPEGPVLIEGNSDYGITGNDLTEGGFMNNKVFRKILAEYSSLAKK